MAQGEAGRSQVAGAPRRDDDREDALDLLARDHREVEALFDRYTETGEGSERAALTQRICRLLRVHAQIEDEIFYPAARRRIADRDLVGEALVEHHNAMTLIRDIETARPGDPMVEARMQVLAERVADHVHEEETELFPEVRQAAIDLRGLGSRLAQRRRELLAAFAADAELEDEPRSFFDLG
jgi:hemerythrin superfamily protein